MSPDDRPSPRADLWSAVFWIAFGGAILVASWRMDRLEHLGATLYTAPGLVPGMLGAVILLLGVLLALRAMRQPSAPVSAAVQEDGDDRPWLRVAVVLALCLGYAVGLIGHAPFWLGTFLFVFLFVLFFEYPQRKARGQVPRGVAMAVVYGAATSFIVSTVFEKVFLVRLP